MVVKLRFQRFGKKDAPFYRLVAADARSPRDGKKIEQVHASPFPTGLPSRCLQHHI
jgi:ribosomal protein S16